MIFSSTYCFILFKIMCLFLMTIYENSKGISRKIFFVNTHSPDREHVHLRASSGHYYSFEIFQKRLYLQTETLPYHSKPLLFHAIPILL